MKVTFVYEIICFRELRTILNLMEGLKTGTGSLYFRKAANPLSGYKTDADPDLNQDPRFVIPLKTNLLLIFSIFFQFPSFQYKKERSIFLNWVINILQVECNWRKRKTNI
jgi:hypothetical protein